MGKDEVRFFFIYLVKENKDSLLQPNWAGLAIFYIAYMQGSTNFTAEN